MQRTGQVEQHTARWDTPGGLVFSVCGQTCGQRVSDHNGQEKKVTEIAGSRELSEALTGINLLISMERYMH